jgi:hypothetical protein
MRRPSVVAHIAITANMTVVDAPAHRYAWEGAVLALRLIRAVP